MSASDDIDAYPLSWPTGWVTTPASLRQHSRFSTRGRAEGQSFQRTRELTFAEAKTRLFDELRRLEATGITLSTNVKPSRSGAILARDVEKRLAEPGAAVYFTLKRQSRCLACDRYATLAGNLAAIAAHIAALRAIDRYGIGTVDQAFAGYAPRLQAASVDWHIVLGVPPSATLERAETAFTALARTAHPDAGGTHEAMSRLTEAISYARHALRTP